MFIFGAGASYDSDPNRLPHDDHDEVYSRYHYRPPLAPGLFAPTSDVGQEAVAEFPRAAPLLMQLAEATRNDLDVEEVMEEFALGEASYPETAVQLLAFRAYLARLLDKVPREWAKECQGLTNYVLTLDQAHRWNTGRESEAVPSPIACVTFNYDQLLEDAVVRVFGHNLRSMEAYTQDERIHVYKPHGSVHWRQSARWEDSGSFYGSGGLHEATAVAADLKWDADIFRWDHGEDYQDRNDPRRFWLPALSIPVRRKSDFTMPSSHRLSLIEDLRQVTTVIAVGWRARERHFLRLMQEHMSEERLANLIVVSESAGSAMETVGNIWETGRFQRYLISDLGFTGFAKPVIGQHFAGDNTGKRLHDVLTRRPRWTGRPPDSGTELRVESEDLPPFRQHYGEL